MARTDFSLVNIGSLSLKGISSRLVSLLGSLPPLTFSKSADGPCLLKGALSKRDTILELTLFWGQGLFYIIAMVFSYTV